MQKYFQVVSIFQSFKKYFGFRTLSNVYEKVLQGNSIIDV